MQNYWKSNLQFLEKHASEKTLACLCATTEADSMTAVCRRPETGGIEMYLQGCNEERLDLCSSRDTFGEAQRLVDVWWGNQKPDPDAFVVAFGLGSGVQLAAIAELLEQNGTILAMDCCPAAVRALLEHIDLRAMGLERPGINFQLAVNDDQSAFIGEFSRAATMYMRRLNVSFFGHPAAMRANPEAYRELTRKISLHTGMENSERATVRGCNQEWFQNTIINLPALTAAAAPILALKQMFKGVPAAVVAAGPTLEQSLPLLRELQQRMLIIAVGTALKPLLAAGIKPHLTVIVDGSPKVYEQFAGLPQIDAWLIAISQSDPRILAQFNERIFAFDAIFQGVEEWLENSGVGSDRLPVGGTVSLTAMALPEYMGCPEAFIFGLDLAFRDDGTSHAGNSMYDGQRTSLNELVPVPGNWRPAVYTTMQFRQYIERLENIMPDTQTPLTNVNPDGALIKGLKVIRPEALAPTDFPVQPCLFTRISELGMQKRCCKDTFLNAVSKVLKDMPQIEERASQAVNICTELLQPGLDDIRRASLTERLEAVEKDIQADNSPASRIVGEGVKAASQRTLSFHLGHKVDEKAFEKAILYCGSLYEEIATNAAWIREKMQEWLPRENNGKDINTENKQEV